jgi:hypothetical protein
MAEKKTIDLSTAIPASAKSAIITFKCSSPTSKALLHRFDGDQSPAVLHGPSGQLEVNVAQGRKLFLEQLDAADWELGVSGYSF